ncbi:uridine kinase [Paraburkholderia sp. GAS33]|jgi:uridine kinase|uniref:AAA family ATPase n=1 Tax=unclassified Paraburkholderia TaxID=2615204 RepID=UPI003D1FF233
MNRFAYRRINIVGAAGSGTTTLGRALAMRLGFNFVDADSFYWKPTVPPFKEKYDPERRLTMLLDEIEACDASVLSGSVCGWGSELENSFDLVIFLSLPTALRLQRIEAREMSLFGGADPAFLAWAAQYEEGKLPGRSRARHEAWLESRMCRVLRFDEDQAVDTRVEQIVDFRPSVSSSVYPRGKELP